jgi:Lipoprotein LpqB beta-propeller domain/Sporulation and spore germination
MRRPLRHPSLLAVGLAVATSAGVTSCVRVPDNGPVVEANTRVQVEDAQAPFSRPRPPQPGARPNDIVSGFLEAMVATPLQTNGAAEYLTTQGRSVWHPDQVLSYTTEQVGTPRRDTVQVRLSGTERIGSRGQWLGRVPPGAARLTFPMEREDGEWRIARAPDALILPQSFYDQNFQDAALYFFDPSGRILVPEPVHVPEGSQLASSLVRALLRGPQPSLDNGVTRTFIPPGLEVGLSVPVDRKVAAVNLNGADPGTLSRRSVRRMLAQLAWTLRQDPSISSFTLTIAGHPVTDASGVSHFPVTSAEADRYDPAGGRATGQSYALRHGRLVSGLLGRPSPVNGPFGYTAQGVGPFAVNLSSTTVAGVTPDALLLGSFLGEGEPATLLTGSGLLRPAWDFANRLWEIQDRPRGALVMYAAHGNVHRVYVPGISGRHVTRFLMSRDGSRIVAVLRGATADHIVTSRIRYDADGRATRGTRALPIRWDSSGTTRIRDLGWTTPTTIAVLDQLSPAHAEVRILNVDGSMAPNETSPTSINGRVVGLVTSPVAAQTPYAVVKSSGLVDISPAVPTRTLPIGGLRHLTYAG